MRLLNRLRAPQLLLTVACAYLLGFGAHALYLKKTVYGDGLYYYSWLQLHASQNKFSIGPALLWAPAYMATHSEFAVGVVSVLGVLFGLILLYDTLTRSFSKTVSVMTVITVAGATNLLFYGSLDAVNSHAPSFFAASVFLALLLRRRHWFAVGLSLGVLGLMRAQDLLFAVLLIPLVTRKNLIAVIAGTAIAFSPQIIAWYLTTGRLFTNPYLAGNEGFTVFRPHLLEVLFNPHDGLFLWTPATLIGILGLIQSKRYWFLAVFLCQLYIVAAWSTWWQGASYSGRMFVSSLPILAFGIAAIYSLLAKSKLNQSYFLLAIIGPLSIINSIAIIYFLLTLPGR